MYNKGRASKTCLGHGLTPAFKECLGAGCALGLDKLVGIGTAASGMCLQHSTCMTLTVSC